jgi:hypothetical protein
VKQIFDAQRAKRDAKHEQMNTELDQQLSAVLTPARLAKSQEIREHRPMGPPPGEGSGSQNP